MEKKYRLALVVTRMNTGGVAVLIDNLLRHIDQTKFEVLLLTGYCTPDEKDYLAELAPKYKVLYVKHLNRRINPIRDALAFLEIYALLHKFKPNIIHTHTSKGGLLGRLAAFFLINSTPRIVHTFHGHILYGYFGKLAISVVIYTERVLAKFTHKLIAMGNSVKHDLIEIRIAPEAKFQVFYPGVDLSGWRSPSQIHRKFREDLKESVIFTFVGRLVPIKRVDRIIELAKWVKNEKLRAYFLLVGHGEQYEKIDHECQTYQLPIYVTGWTSNPEQWLQISDVALLVSDNEAVPLALIESSFAKLPLIGTNVGAVSDVLVDRQNGLLVEPNLESLKNAIQYMLENPTKRDEWGNNAFTYAKTKFSFERMVIDHTELYLSLLSTQ